MFYKSAYSTPMRFDYYSLYLHKFLRDSDDSRKNDEEFISCRADLAAEEYENVRRGGASGAVALECAMAVLIEGL